MTDLTIQAEGLGKDFGTIQALHDLDLAVPPGTVLGLLGPNGAGKTTTVRILTTLLRPDTGHAQVAGHDVARQPAAVRQAIGLSGQSAAVDGHLTGHENLHMVGRLYHLDRVQAQHRTAELLERFELAEAADRPVRTYSGGMRRRLDLAVSLSATRRCYSWTNPAAAWTPMAATSCGRPSGSSSRPAPPCCSPVPGGSRPARRPHRGHRPRPQYR